MKAQGEQGDTLLLASVPPETTQVGAESVCLGVSCRVGGHISRHGESRDLERVQKVACTWAPSLLPSSVFSPFRKGRGSQGGEDQGARMAGRRPGPQSRFRVCLVLVAVAVVFGEEQETKPFGETCLEDFTVGMPGLVLDTDASVQNGATFLSSPMVHRGRDCMRACCKDPACNLALVEQVPNSGEDDIQGCFLLNCLYEHTFVCRFMRKAGFLNFLKKDVYGAYEAMQKHGSNGKVPIMDLCKLGLGEH